MCCRRSRRRRRCYGWLSSSLILTSSTIKLNHKSATHQTIVDAVTHRVKLNDHKQLNWLVSINMIQSRNQVNSNSFDDASLFVAVSLAPRDHHKILSINQLFKWIVDATKKNRILLLFSCLSMHFILFSFEISSHWFVVWTEFLCCLLCVRVCFAYLHIRWQPHQAISIQQYCCNV